MPSGLSTILVQGQEGREREGGRVARRKLLYITQNRIPKGPILLLPRSSESDIQMRFQSSTEHKREINYRVQRQHVAQMRFIHENCPFHHSVTIGLQRYTDLKIKVCDGESIPLHFLLLENALESKNFNFSLFVSNKLQNV